MTVIHSKINMKELHEKPAWFKAHEETDLIAFGVAQMERAEIKNTLIKQVAVDAEFSKTLAEIKGFMANLQWLADSSKGVSLLRKPALWVVALIIGIVAFTGGLKALLLGIASWLKF